MRRYIRIRRLEELAYNEAKARNLKPPVNSKKRGVVTVLPRAAVNKRSSRQTFVTQKSEKSQAADNKVFKPSGPVSSSNADTKLS
jgi:hypothetical protein